MGSGISFLYDAWRDCKGTVNPADCYAEVTTWGDWQWWFYTPKGFFVFILIAIPLFFILVALWNDKWQPTLHRIRENWARQDPRA